jgi:hypothetical protein
MRAACAECGLHADAGPVKAPISARFPAFAEQGRKAIAAAHVPKEAAQAEQTCAPTDSTKPAALADVQPARHPEITTKEEPAAPDQVDTKAPLEGAGSLPDAGADSDASSSSNDAKHQSPPKKARQALQG